MIVDQERTERTDHRQRCRIQHVIDLCNRQCKEQCDHNGHAGGQTVQTVCKVSSVHRTKNGKDRDRIKPSLQIHHAVERYHGRCPIRGSKRHIQHQSDHKNDLQRHFLPCFQAL